MGSRGIAHTPRITREYIYSLEKRPERCTPVGVKGASVAALKMQWPPGGSHTMTKVDWTCAPSSSLLPVFIGHRPGYKTV